jgi:hypothetical protein
MYALTITFADHKNNAFVELGGATWKTRKERLQQSCLMVLNMPDVWSVAFDVLKVVAGGAVGWFLHIGKERLDRKRLRYAMYRELANNYAALLYNSAQGRCDFDWLRNNFTHELAFHAYKKAAGNPEAFYRIPEHGWLERSFKELQKCTTLPPDDKDLIGQLTLACGTIEGIAPPADAKMFRSMLPNQYAAHIK